MIKALYTFLIGAIGGVIAYYLSLPIPWMLGSLISVAATQYLNIELAPPHKSFSRWVRVVIGVTIGASVAESLNELSASIFSTIIIALSYVVIITVFGYWFFKRIKGFQRVDSFMSSLPGGLSFLIVLAGDLGDRFPKIALIHSVRIVTIVFSFSILAMFMGADDVNHIKGNPIAFDWHFDLLKIVLLVFVSGFLADLLKLAGGHVIIGLLLSAIAYQFNLIQVDIPELVITISMIFLGGLLGYELAKTNAKENFTLIRASLIFTFVALILAVLIALVSSEILNESYLLYLLALAPGGIAEISLITLALGLDAGFVAIVHAFRFIFILTVGPIGLNRLTKQIEKDRD